MEQQINTFEALFPHIQANGVYLCEDLHMSYVGGFGGRYKGKGTFIEIDAINAWHSHEPKKVAVTDFTRSAHSSHYYDSILVVEKRPMVAPEHIQTGKPSRPHG